MRSRRRRLRGRFQRARDARLRDGNVGGPSGPARGSLQKSASWSARTRAPKFDLREAPHAAPGRSPTHVPLKKGPPGPRGPEHQNSTRGRHRTRPPSEVRRSGPSKKGRLVRADQRARNLRNRAPGVPSGVPCGEGRIEDEAAGRIEGRAALVTPRNSCPGPATLHLACTPTNGVPSARPLSPNHWGEGSGSCHPKKFKNGGWRGRGKDGCSQEFGNSLVQGQVGLREEGSGVVEKR